MVLKIVLIMLFTSGHAVCVNSRVFPQFDSLTVRGYASPQETLVVWLSCNNFKKLLHGEGMSSLLRAGTCKHQVATEIL